MHCTYHQLLSPPFPTLDWQWVCSVILRKPTKPSVHYFKSLVRVCVYVWHTRVCSCMQVSTCAYVGCVCPHQTQASFINNSPPRFWRQYLSLALGWGFPTSLGWLTRKLQRSAVSVSSTFRSWCLRGKYFTYWAISPATVIIFEVFFKCLG